MHPIAKFLILAGLLLVGLGLVFQLGTRFLHFGRLPGDIVIERENFRFYFPLMTSILLSVLLSLLLSLIVLFLRHR